MPQVPLEGPIAVIDDDLRAWRIADFDDRQAVLDDPDVDAFEELWAFAVGQKLVVDTEDDGERVERLGHNEVIDEIVTNPLFAKQHERVWE